MKLKKIAGKALLVMIMVTLLPMAANAQKWDGLAKTPPMGWNSWNKFASNINEKQIKEIADAMVSTGLRDAGYVYLNLDDTWHGARDANGFITADAKKFPNGIKALADYVHSKGLKFGIYSDAGCQTCGGMPGSLGHEYQDAITYANWGVDYLKYDWCNTTDVNPKGAYALMRDALHSAGRPIVLSMCEWGNSKPWEWAQNVGHSWRTTADICCCFDCVLDFGTFQQLGVTAILDKNEPLRASAGPGHWNDPDMLEVGNGMTVNQDRAHFTLWCMMAAPLILGNDIRNMSAETKTIIMNKDVIAIDQDPLGVQGMRYKTESGLEFWFKPLEGGDWAMCIFNRTLEARDYTIYWGAYDFHDSVSGKNTELYRHTYKVKNLWSGKDEGTTATAKKVAIPAQDVVLYRLTR